MSQKSSMNSAQTPKKEPTLTERRTFTDEQLTLLRSSPYIYRATAKVVSYTLEFKELLWKRYCEGEPPEKVFSDFGIDPAVIGHARLWGVITLLRKQKEKGRNFLEGNEPHISVNTVRTFVIPKPPRPPKLPRNPTRTVSDAEILKLYHQVAYLSQEMEFLKKTILAGGGTKSK